METPGGIDRVKMQDLLDKLKNVFGAEPMEHEGKSRGFQCPHREKCMPKLEECVAMSPIFPDFPERISGRRIMLVGEAPSTRGGKGVITGGIYEQCEEEIRKEPGLSALYDFVKRSFDHAVPYFTDAVKCGTAPGERKKVLAARADTCFNIFLRYEIQAFNPEIIICAGKISYDTIKEKNANDELISASNIVKILHYGRQAGLPLSAKEKRDIIWPIQIARAMGGRIHAGIQDAKIQDISYLKGNQED